LPRNRTLNAGILSAFSGPGKQIFWTAVQAADSAISAARHGERPPPRAGRSRLIQFGVFPCRAAGLADGVLPGIGRGFGPNGLVDVHAEAIGQQQGTDQDVGEFVDDLLPLSRSREVGC
jgi:hypothetical protein